MAKETFRFDDSEDILLGKFVALVFFEKCKDGKANVSLQIDYGEAAKTLTEPRAAAVAMKICGLFKQAMLRSGDYQMDQYGMKVSEDPPAASVGFDFTHSNKTDREIPQADVERVKADILAAFNSHAEEIEALQQPPVGLETVEKTLMGAIGSELTAANIAQLMQQLRQADGRTV